MLEKIKRHFAKFNASSENKKKMSLVLVGVILLLVLISGIIVGSRYHSMEEEKQRRASMGDMVIWYTNDSLTEYLDFVAEDYEKETGMHVVPKKVSPVDYVETIYAASISDTVSTPDVFITTNDVLEQAYLAGVATSQHVEMTDKEFPGTAINAITYKGKMIAYPFYFDTSVLLYNKNFIQEAPTSMEEMLTLADEFEIPGGVENILKWDCSNGFRNYFFGGNYMDIAGPCGDDSSVLRLYNDSLIQSLQYFQTMNDYFSIDIETVTEEVLIEEFAAGKTLFCFGDTSWFSVLEEKGMTNYGVAMLPDLNDTLDSKGIAITNVVAINGFSNKQEEAVAFAEALTMEYAKDLYGLSGKVPAALTFDVGHEGCIAARKQYQTCAQLPKLMNMGDFWVQFEIALDDIWKGSDAATVMSNLEKETAAQIQ